MSSPEEIQKIRMQYFLDFMKDKENCKILDIGCQSGDLCHSLSQQGHEAYGVDVVEELVKEARRRFPDNIFECSCREFYKRIHCCGCK